MDRRTFLRHGAVLAAPLLWRCLDRDLPGWIGVADELALPDGVVAGSPSPNGIHLVLRVTDLVGAPRLGVEIAEASANEVRAPVLRETVPIPEDAAQRPLHVRIDSARLSPDRRYAYRLVTRSGATSWRLFRTAPLPDASRPVRLAFFSCQGWQAGYFTSHAGLAQEPDLDLAVCLGDYIYDLTDDQGPPDRVDTIGAGGSGFAESLEEYRAKYRLYRSDADLQGMHAVHPCVAVWDNHELADDSPGHLGSLVPRVPLEARNANGRAAFWEFMPMDPGPAEQPLHRALRLGQMVELFLLDLHSFAAPIASGGSYLGLAQREWLLGALAASTARWKLIASSTVMMGLDFAAGSPVNLNQWDGYGEERAAIIDYVRSQGIQGVVVLSGDLHTFLAAPVTTTGRADGAPGAVEFCCGAISSEGLLNLRPGQEDAARALEGLAREANPHLRFIDVLARGYGVLEARPDELLVWFRSPGNVYERVSPMRDLARFRLAWGATELERLA